MVLRINFVFAGIEDDGDKFAIVLGSEERSDIPFKCLLPTEFVGLTDNDMNRSTAILLVCLRLAIGWHFAVEGWHKVHSQIIGPAETNKVFSSEGFFREAPGPLARLMKSQLGDPDEELLSRLTVQPMPADADPAKYPAQKRIPPALAQDWEDYFSRFASFYGLDDQQRKLGEAKVEQAEHNVVVWLTQGDKEVKKTFATGDVETKLGNPQRIAEYRTQLQELRDVYGKKLPAFAKDVEKAKLVKAKTDLASLRSSLAADLAGKTEELKKILDDTLTPEQKALGDLPGQDSNWKVKWLNIATAWGLLAIGIGLLFGLFTRLWCVFGAGFLLMTYLAAPPMPWWPTPPQQEGTYLFINKNVVEMLALLALATTRSGRWFGIDAVIHGLFTGFREERQKDSR